MRQRRRVRAVRLEGTDAVPAHTPFVLVSRRPLGAQAAERLWPDIFLAPAALAEKARVVEEMRLVRPVIETGYENLVQARPLRKPSPPSRAAAGGAAPGREGSAHRCGCCWSGCTRRRTCSSAGGAPRPPTAPPPRPPGARPPAGTCGCCDAARGARLEVRPLATPQDAASRVHGPLGAEPRAAGGSIRRRARRLDAGGHGGVVGPQPSVPGAAAAAAPRRRGAVG